MECSITANVCVSLQVEIFLSKKLQNGNRILFKRGTPENLLWRHRQRSTWWNRPVHTRVLHVAWNTSLRRRSIFKELKTHENEKPASKNSHNLPRPLDALLRQDSYCAGIEEQPRSLCWSLPIRVRLGSMAAKRILVGLIWLYKNNIITIENLKNIK